LNELLEQVQAGDEIVLSRNGQDIERIVTPSLAEMAPSKRVAGLNKGWISYIADDFDAELPDSFWLGEA
ncbi:toxin-antitoxin (TA) system antitoxin, partial [bacterium]